MTTNQNKPGLACPRCREHIAVSAVELLAGKIQCPRCYLALYVDRNASQTALDALKKIRQAEENVQKASHFNR